MNNLLQISKAFTHTKTWLAILVLILGLGLNANGQYTVNFDGTGETKTGYASGTVSLNGTNWDLTSTLIGTTTGSDRFNGTRSARIQSTGTLTMLANKTGGIGNFSLNYAKYGTDANSSFRVEYSTNNGTNWIQIGSDVSVTSTTLTSFSVTGVNYSGDYRLKITKITTSSTSNRLSIDDIAVTGYSLTAPTINFAAITTPQTYGASSFTVSSTSNSAGAITYSSDNTAVATVSGTTVSIVGAGVAVITATQAANGSFSSGTATRTLTVNAKQLTFSTFTFPDKIYNSNNTAVPTQGTLSGTVNSDVITISGSSTASYTYNNANVGTTKPISVTGTYLLSGTKASSYTIVTPSTSLTGNIVAKELTITGLSANSRQYEAGNSAVTISGTPALSGVLAADLSNVTLSGTATGAFLNDAVENNKAVTISGLSITGSAIGNYSLTVPTNLTASITAAAVPNIGVANNITALTTTYGTASSATSFTVGGSDISGGIQVTPPVGYQVSTTSDFSANIGSNASPLTISGTGTIATTTVYLRFAATASAGSYTSGIIAVTSSGATQRDLSIATSTVNQKSLTISGVSTSDRVYNATSVATLTTGTLVGVVSGDEANVTLAQGSGAFADANIGTAKTVTISGFGISGTKAANYSLTQPSNLSASITAKNLTITGASATNRTFASGNTSVTVSGTLVGVEGSDVVTFTGSIATDAAGTNRPVTFTLAGANAGNYTLTQPTVTVNITIAIVGGELTASGYTQNFDASSSTTPNGWSVNNGTALLNGTGSFTTGGAYSFLAGSSDRAIGIMASGSFSLPRTMTFQFTNNTGSTITSLITNWNYERFRTNTAVQDWAFTTSAGTISSGTGAKSFATGASSYSYLSEALTSPITITGLNVAVGGTITFTWTLSGTASNSQATGIDDFSVSVPANITASLSTLGGNNNTTYGTASAIQTYNLSASNMGTTNMVVTAPSGFQLSSNGGTTWSSSLTFTPVAETLATTTISVSIPATTTPGTYSGNITNAVGSTVSNVATVSSTVAQKALTISGISVPNKVYNGLTSSSFSGATLNGIVGSDVVTLNSSAVTYAFTDANIGIGKTLNRTGNFALAGTNAGNYTLTQPATSTTADITAKELTITSASATTRFYIANSTTVTVTGTLVGVQNGETITLTGSIPAHAAPGIYDVTFTINGSTIGNYTLVQPSPQVTVEITIPPVATINVGTIASGLTTTYGTASANGVFTLSGSDLEGTVTITPPTGFEIAEASDFSGTVGTNSAPLVINGGTTISSTNIYIRLTATTTAGSYAGLQITTSSLNANNPSVSIPSSVVNSKGLTISGVAAQNKAYNGTNVATLSAGILVGVLDADAADVNLNSGTATFGQTSVGNGLTVSLASNYTITGSKAVNYSLTQPAGLTANIISRELTITGAGATNRVYAAGNTTVAVTGTIVGAQNSESLTLTGSVATDAIGNNKPVTFSVTGTTAGNYTLTQPTPEVTVNITVEILGLALNSFTYTQNFDGLTTGTFTDNSTIAGWYTQRTGSGGTRTYTVDNGTSNSGGLFNYGTTSATDRALGSIGSSNAAAGSFYHGFAFTNNTGATLTTLTVTYTMEVWRLGVASTAQNITVDYKTYSAFPTLTGNWLNTLAGTTAVTQLTAGIATITGAAGAIDGNATANKVTVSHTITGLNLADGQYMVIRFSDPDHSGTDNGQAIDDFSISAPSPSILTLKEGVTTVANASDVVFAAGGQNLQGTKTLTITNTGTTALNIASISRTSGDEAFTLSGVPTTVAGNGTADFTLTFDRTTQGTDRTALFTITSDNGGVANTTQTFTAKGTVTAPETTISASGTLIALNTTYGTVSANTSFNVSGTNISGGIQVNPPVGFQVSTTAGFTANVGTNGNPITVGGNGVIASTLVYVRIPTTVVPGTYSGNIVLSSTNATDLNVATVSSTVGVKPITITGLSVTSKTYNKANDATITGTPSLTGVINGNTVTVTGTAAGTFADVNVGSGKTVNITGLSLSGTDAAYYSLSAPSLTTGIIIVKTLTVTGATATSKEYDASTTAAVNGTLVGIESGDVVTLTGSFASITVGTAKPVTFGLSGASASNYSVTQPTPQVTANITAPAYPYIYKNDITGTDTYLTNPYTTGQYSDPNISVSGLTRGPGLTGAAGGDRFSASQFTTSATIDPALDYYEITITPNSGIKFNLTQFKFSSQRSGTAMSVAVRSSLDNYTANLGSPTTGGSETNASVSLGASFFNLNTATTFRIYGFSSNAPGTTFSINSFEVIGTTYDENTASGLPNTSIFENDITGTTPGGTNPFTTGQIVNSNLTVEGIRRGTGISSATGDDRFNATSWDQSLRNTSDYFEFKITPNAGYLVNFYSFVYNGERSASGPDNFAVYSSVDNYNTAIATVGSGESAAVTVNLNTATFKNITSVITFRVYAWGGSGGNYSINNFQFNGGVVKLGGIFRTTASGDFSNAATWQYSESDVNPVWYVSPIVPTSDATSIQVQENHNLTINVPTTVQNLTVPSNATLTIANGQTLTINNGAGTDLAITGTLVNNGTIAQATDATGSFAANSNYIHGTNGGAVPTATWSASSTATFNGITSTAPTGLGQTFGNVVWNNPSQNADINLGLASNTIIAGNLNITSTNTSNLVLSGSDASTVTINGNLNLNGGSLLLNNGSTGTDNVVVGGNFNFNGGTISSGTGNVANLQIAGNLNIAANATVVPTSGLKFVLNGASTKNVNNSNTATNLGLLEINKTIGGVVLNNSIAVNTIDFQSGSVDATQTGINLTVNTAILNEGVGKKIIGNSISTVTVTERGATEYNFNNAGLTLIFPANGGALPGTISVTRITNTSVTGATGAASVARRFNITASNNQNLNCTMKFSVLSDELNGLTAANLNLSRSTNSGSSWITVARNGSVVTASDVSVVTATGINAFSDWTLEGDNAPLPVTLVSFNGKATLFGNELTWITSSELNNQGFRIERSENGKDFTTIGFVTGKGTTNAKQTYSYSDAFGQAYYRLTQVDFDGKTTLSNVIFVGSESKLEVSIAPNPSNGAARLMLSGNNTDILTLSLITADGKALQTISGASNTLSDTFYGISGKLTAGTYYVKVVSANGVQTIKFIKR